MLRQRRFGWMVNIAHFSGYPPPNYSPVGEPAEPFNPVAFRSVSPNDHDCDDHERRDQRKSAIGQL
jgi:hypothetical protein